MTPKLVPGPAWRAALLAVGPWLIVLSTGATARANPVAPSAASAAPAPSDHALRYQSPLSDYQRFDPPAIGNWRQANDTVRDIGGWRSYLRETSATDGKPTPPTQPANPAASTTPSATQPAATGPAHHPHGGAR